jgi:hypothetical protein
MSDHVHHMMVGARAHTVVAAVLRDGPYKSRYELSVAITTAARSAFRSGNVQRPREAFFDVITAAGVYLHRFQPADPWKLVGTELKAEGCRFDLVFKHPVHGVLIDELKLGVSRRSDAAVREQIDKYVHVGSKVYGACFVGVRLCQVHQPMESRLFSPKSQRSTLICESLLSDSLAVR